MASMNGANQPLQRIVPTLSESESNRGLKRPRRPESSGSERSGSPGGDYINVYEDDEVDVPLSKRINRLNIEKEDVKPADFQQLYPYAPQSHYFKSNQLLRDLYLLRESRKPAFGDR